MALEATSAFLVRFSLNVANTRTLNSSDVAATVVGLRIRVSIASRAKEGEPEARPREAEAAAKHNTSHRSSGQPPGAATQAARVGQALLLLRTTRTMNGRRNPPRKGGLSR